jgi:hypothetical protein
MNTEALLCGVCAVRAACDDTERKGRDLDAEIASLWSALNAEAEARASLESELERIS